MKNKISKTLLFMIMLLSVVALVLGVTLFNSPSACSGQWTSCSNAFANDANRATASVSATSNKSGIWNNYGLSITQGSTINRVNVRADFFASRTSGFINVKVSGDSGLTYGPSHIVGGNTAEQTFNIDVTNDIAWTPNNLNNTNFRVKVTCFRSDGTAAGRFNGISTNPTCNLDWVPVNVTYTPPCIRANPQVTINPTIGNGTAGSTVNYRVWVTNFDSNQCGVSSFTMIGSIIPRNWTGIFNDGTLVINPQNTAITNFSLTSTLNATLGSYNFSITAINFNNSLFRGSVDALYNVI